MIASMVTDASHEFNHHIQNIAAFCFLTAATAMFASILWDLRFSCWSMIPVLFMLAACIVCRPNQSPDFACSLITIAWLITTFGFTHSAIYSFESVSISHPDLQRLQEEIQNRILQVVGEWMLFPLILTVPAVYVMARTSGRSASRARKWIVLSAILAAADCIVSAAFLVLILEHSSP